MSDNNDDSTAPSDVMKDGFLDEFFETGGKKEIEKENVVSNDENDDAVELRDYLSSSCLSSGDNFGPVEVDFSIFSSTCSFVDNLMKSNSILNEADKVLSEGAAVERDCFLERKKMKSKVLDPSFLKYYDEIIDL